MAVVNTDVWLRMSFSYNQSLFFLPLSYGLHCIKWGRRKTKYCRVWLRIPGLGFQAKDWSRGTGPRSNEKFWFLSGRNIPIFLIAGWVVASKIQVNFIRYFFLKSADICITQTNFDRILTLWYRQGLKIV